MNFFLIKKKFFDIFLIYLFLLFLISYDLLFSTFNYSHTILIKPNESLTDISRTLYKNKIIKSKMCFQFLVRIFLIEKKLKAGEYEFYGQNIFQIIKKINNGHAYQRKLTIPEGLTSLQIINILENTEGIIVNQEIKIPNEGTIFPSTYFFVYGTDINKVIDRMQEAMNITLNEIWNNKDKDLVLKNYNELLILASIIEKETSLNEEKPIIAQVFLKRLNLNMKLQSDPTVIYGIKQSLGEFSDDLTKNDLKFDSPYNTYLYHGLPKGPISNPGTDSLLAAVKPSKSNFLYFVADSFGTHYFSKNYDEHLENIKHIKQNK